MRICDGPVSAAKFAARRGSEHSLSRQALHSRRAAAIPLRDKTKSSRRRARIRTRKRVRPAAGSRRRRLPRRRRAHPLHRQTRRSITVRGSTMRQSSSRAMSGLDWRPDTGAATAIGNSMPRWRVRRSASAAVSRQAAACPSITSATQTAFQKTGLETFRCTGRSNCSIPIARRMRSGSR